MEAGINALVTPIQEQDSDTTAFFHRFQLEPHLGANCVIVEGQRGETRRLAACITLGADRIDLNGAVRKSLDARKVRMAPPEVLIQLDMESGGVSPFGLPTEWTLLVDPAVSQAEELIVGSGIRTSKLLVSGYSLSQIPGAMNCAITRQ
ncbi:hypothetical protein H6F58_04770 [Glutamicibacter sp. FBE19]|nr:hypothetical protein [Glutamicibacter sp. FBE19]